MKNVRIVVDVLMISCHVSLKPNSGPLIAQTARSDERDQEELPRPRGERDPSREITKKFSHSSTTSDLVRRIIADRRLTDIFERPSDRLPLPGEASRVILSVCLSTWIATSSRA